ncbi:aminoglycoside phosphotransferase family protein [Streptomyces luteireticuli]|uniref:Phosphotransferase n=1 Tax=Streptomyces luteireticuli TaxID=173858 RepID=A0ABP3IS70_9ACTN
MTTRIPDSVPAPCRQRLVAHYGDAVHTWLDSIPDLLRTAAERWHLSLGDYHDAGHASVIALAPAEAGCRVIVKAWADPVRFHREIQALRLWTDGPAARVIAVADDLAVAVLETVGGHPGGAARPAREEMRVASAIQQLHGRGRVAALPHAFPPLSAFLNDEVLPRIRHRAIVLGLHKHRHFIGNELRMLGDLAERRERRTVLHADLYRENALFDEAGRPVLIDPLPMAGDAAFDWAFWSVYYDVGRRTHYRLTTAAQTSGIPASEILPWCRLLALDGLLYYLDTHDPRATRMAQTLTRLAEGTGDLP